MEKYNKEDLERLLIVVGKKEYRGEFSNCRIESSSLPTGKYKYEIRSTDDGSIGFRTISKQVIVNFTGTFISDEIISEIEKSGEVDIVDWNFEG